jgi:hypothetical protein
MKWKETVVHHPDIFLKTLRKITLNISQFQPGSFEMRNNSRTVALGSSQPLAEMGTKNLPGGKADITAISEPIF